jgi:chromosome segregation ATPase
MHPDTAQTTNVTLLPQQPPQQQSNFALVVHRLDDHSAKLEKLDAKIEKLDAKVDEKFEKLDAKIEKLDAKLDAKIEKLDAKVDEKFEKLDAKVDALRNDMHAQGDALRNDMQTHFEKFRKDMKDDMREVVSAAMAPVNERFNTFDERIKHAATAADNKLLRWCAGSAAGASSLGYLVSRLLS